MSSNVNQSVWPAGEPNSVTDDEDFPNVFSMTMDEDEYAATPEKAAKMTSAGKDEDCDVGGAMVHKHTKVKDMFKVPDVPRRFLTKNWRKLAIEEAYSRRRKYVKELQALEERMSHLRRETEAVRFQFHRRKRALDEVDLDIEKMELAEEYGRKAE